ncbi:hypothetical protein R3P38DRAFT_3235161 [Favolaschia claudopus]|uniref:Uncharacterized protein n=1 Tax=Favolaschia claudopus TaxID=2862362 RepID=A0AAV9ZFH7_9AGAR
MSDSDPAHDSFMSLIRSRIPGLVAHVLEPLPSQARSSDLDISLRSLIEFVAGLGFSNGMDCVDVERIRKEAYKDGKREGLKAGMDLGLAKAAQQKPGAVSVAVQASIDPPRCVSASTQTFSHDSLSGFTTSTSAQTSPAFNNSILPLSPASLSTISDDELENQKVLPAPSPPFVRDFSALRSGDCRPFASLQHRHKRSTRPRPRHNCFRTYSTPKACSPTRPQKFIRHGVAHSTDVGCYCVVIQSARTTSTFEVYSQELAPLDYHFFGDILSIIPLGSPGSLNIRTHATVHVCGVPSDSDKPNSTFDIKAEQYLSATKTPDNAFPVHCVFPATPRWEKYKPIPGKGKSVSVEGFLTGLELNAN